jgi:hypothetical protein
VLGRTLHGVLEGSIVDENFVPIQGAKVLLMGTERVTETTWNGHFRFLDLQPKLYRVKIDAPAWTPAVVEAQVQADRATRVTIFLDPLRILEPYSTLQQVRGELSCADIEAGSSLTCQLQYHSTNFPREWAAFLIEVNWGPSGYSSSTLAQLTAEDRQAEALYANLVAERPGRVQLVGGTLHDDQGGTTPTPPAGTRSPLEIGLKKDPAHLGSAIGAGVTFQQGYEMFLTTFYYAVPTDLESYTAMP